MGREICRASLETEGIELVGGTVRASAPELGSDVGELCGLGKTGVVATEDPPEAAEVLIEFTTPEATVEHLSYQRPHVIGTTGLSAGQLASVEEASHNVPIVRAPNMSVGVNLLRGVVREISAKLGEGYDIEVVEAHHKNKKDAPSGTALFLARAAAEGRDRIWTRSRSTGGRVWPPDRGVRSESTPCVAARSSGSTGSSSIRVEKRSRSSTAPSPAAPSPTAP